MRRIEIKFLKRIGIQIDANIISKFSAVSSINFWRSICREKKLNLRAESYLHALDNCILEHMINENIGVCPEGIDLIRRLRNNNIKIAITSSSSQSRAEKILKLSGISSEEAYLISCDECAYYKPHSEIYYKALDLLQLDASECVAVESLQSNLITANHHGFNSIYLNKHQCCSIIRQCLMEVDSLSEIIPESIKLPSVSTIYL